IVVAIVIYGMPADMAGMSFLYGAAFGLLPVGWTIFSAMLLYNITVETGQFSIIRRSVAGLSGDARIQAVLIGFAFGAFLEGAAGGGTPVAICGAIMSLVVPAIFLQFWKPKDEWHYPASKAPVPAAKPPPAPPDAHGEAARLSTAEPEKPELPLTVGRVALAWTPFAIMSVLLLV